MNKILRVIMFSVIFLNDTIDPENVPLIKQFPEARLIPVHSEEEIYAYTSSFSGGKKMLYIDIHQGNFVKPCPGTHKTYRCCQYYTINELTNCPLDCTYCILQHYLDLPVITYYINYQDMLNELEELSKAYPDRIIRIGTGELTDSLALDHIFGLNQKIIQKVLNLKNIVFEVKTKTNRIDHIIPLAFPRLVFSWSVNPEPIVSSEEKKTSSLSARIDAMKRIVQTPAKIGLHFDPLIYHDGWQKNYENLIHQLARAVPQEKIAWISLGAFRHPPDLQYTIIQNHPDSRLYAAEFVTGMDGKQRYPLFLRKQMFQYVYHKLRHSFGNDVFIYFCMELPEVWEDIIGEDPGSNQNLDFWFARNLFQRFPDMNLPEPSPDLYPMDW